MKTTPRTAAPDSQKEGTMNDNKLTILYERLSHEDGREIDYILKNREIVLSQRYSTD